MTQATAEGLIATFVGLFMTVACKPPGRFSMLYNEYLGIKGVGVWTYAAGYLVFGVLLIAIGLDRLGVI